MPPTPKKRRYICRDCGSKRFEKFLRYNWSDKSDSYICKNEDLCVLKMSFKKKLKKKLKK